MASKLLKTIKEKLTPDIVHQVERQGTMLTVLWITSAFLSFGFALALFCLYNRVLTLEAVISTFAR